MTVEFLWDEIGTPIARWRERAIKMFAIGPEEKLFSVRWNNASISYNYLWRKQRAFLERAGIDPAGVAFHGIRKSFLSTMFYQRVEENGGDFMGALRYVQQLAGHESFEMTLRYLSDCIDRSHYETSKNAISKLLGKTDPEKETA